MLSFVLRRRIKTQLKDIEYQLQAIAKLKYRPIWPPNLLCFRRAWVPQLTKNMEPELRAIVSKLGEKNRLDF